MPTRRHVLELLSAAPLLACCSSTNLPDPVAAWRNPGVGESDPRRFALAHAILAPNPHNRQPWLVELVGDDSLVLFADLTRLLPATDPPNRQITIGCGAFLELLAIAACETGHRVEMVLWPEGEPQPVLDRRPVARARFVRDADVAKDPLFGQIIHRRTNRLQFEPRDVPAVDMETLRAAAQSQACRAFVVSDGAKREAMRNLTRRSWRVEASTPRTIQESIDLTRIGHDEIARYPDGLVLQGPLIEALHAVGVLTRAEMAKPGSIAYERQLAFYDPLSASAAAFLGITVATTSRADEIAAGRAYARANLTGAHLGLAMQPMSQALQEFPEMAGSRQEMDALTDAPANGRLHMLARVGYARDVPASPRHPFGEHLRP